MTATATRAPPGGPGVTTTDAKIDLGKEDGGDNEGKGACL